MFIHFFFSYTQNISTYIYFFIYTNTYTNIGQSQQKCSDSYSGASAANQPEIIAVQDYIFNDQRFIGYINFHSYSQLWMSPWGYTADPSPDYDLQNAGIILITILILIVCFFIEI